MRILANGRGVIFLDNKVFVSNTYSGGLLSYNDSLLYDTVSEKFIRSEVGAYLLDELGNNLIDELLDGLVDAEKPVTPFEPEYLCITPLRDGSTATLTWSLDLPGYEYSTDQNEWTAVVSDREIELISPTYFRAVEELFEYPDEQGWGYPQFYFEGKVKVSGCINSMIDPSANPNKELFENCFCNLFYRNRSGLIDASELECPSMILASDCYNSLFGECYSLEQGPIILPASTLAEGCYMYMFDYCESLKQPPILPATLLAPNCYDSMFEGTLALENAPELPATSLATECYKYMFYESGIKTPPVLPAITLAEGCYYNMFGESQLESFPELPATSLSDECYQCMFASCPNIRGSLELPAEIIPKGSTKWSGCYRSMLSGLSSTNITSLTVHAPAKYFEDGTVETEFCNGQAEFMVNNPNIIIYLPDPENVGEYSVFKNCDVRELEA